LDIPLRLLIIDDSDRNVALEVAGYRITYTVAETVDEMKAALAAQAFEVADACVKIFTEKGFQFE
jgi:hypothetical protein